MREFAQKKNKSFRRISREAADVLLSYGWPGNVRELRNLMEWVVFMFDDTVLRVHHLDSLTDNPIPPALEANEKPGGNLPEGCRTLSEFSNQVILEALKRHNGNKTETAKYLGISRSALYYRLKHMK